VAVGLIGANYHFLSDVFSGLFVGTSVGYITTRISEWIFDMIADSDGSGGDLSR
jgi:hypothetical protein